MDQKISKGTDHYFDDIWVDESITTAVEMRLILLECGLVIKDPIPLTIMRVSVLWVMENERGCFTWIEMESCRSWQRKLGTAHLRFTQALRVFNPVMLKSP